MNEFVVSYIGDKIYYDLRSNNENCDTFFHVRLLNGSTFFVRLHREDGPAFIRTDNYMAYYILGKRHNVDGPARIWATGRTDWYINSYQLSFTEWCIELNKSPEEINFLKLKWNIIT